MEAPQVAKATNLPAGFLGKIRQVCMVTADYRRAVEAMLRVGIGPWTVHTFSPKTCTELTYYGRPAHHAFKSALADMPTVLWEVIQPLSGENIYSDFLNQNGEGVHHLLFECQGISWNEKVRGLESAGYTCIQSGKWLGKTTYAYFDAKPSIGTLIEIVDIPSDWKRPEPDEIFR
jgi:methylmalonyl-CoA/ethylmalonyl-CoA epimerase